MGGFGVARNSTRKLFWPLANQVESSRSLNQFAWQAGLGTLYSLSPQFALDINYSILNIGDVTNTGNFNTVASNGVGVIGEPTRLHNLYDNQVQIGMQYKFS